jgi:hypothetical protein
MRTKKDLNTCGTETKQTELLYDIRQLLSILVTDSSAPLVYLERENLLKIAKGE